MNGRIDSVSRFIDASPSTLYQVFMDPTALVQWMPPQGMTGEIEFFDPQVGKGYRMTLTYEGAHTVPGKTSEHTDTVETIFVELIPDKKIVGTAVFKTEDPDVLGELLTTWYFEGWEEGTKVTIIAENVPPGILKADHIEGLNSTLVNLEQFVQMQK